MNAGPSSTSSHSSQSHCAAGADTAADCVLVHPAGTEPSDELRDALAKHRIGVCRASSNFDALAQVVRLSRAPRGRPFILLLAHPTRLHRPEELLRAAQSSAPTATIWVFDPASTPRLRAATADDAKAWTRTPATNPSYGPAAAPVPQPPARPEITFAGPGFAPRTPLAPKPAGKIEPKVVASPAASVPPAPLKLAGSANGHDTSPTPPEAKSQTKHNTNESAVPKRPATPGPKFVGGSWDGGASPFPGSAQGATPRQLLTDEELAMLLADGPTRPHS